MTHSARLRHGFTPWGLGTVSSPLWAPVLIGLAFLGTSAAAGCAPAASTSSGPNPGAPDGGSGGAATESAEAGSGSAEASSGSAEASSGSAEASSGSTEAGSAEAGSAEAGGSIDAAVVFPGVGPGTTDVAAPGAFRSKYYGTFVELPVGTVRAQGWLLGWLQRQDNGLTGHPENDGYPYNAGMYAVGQIPNPTVFHGSNWWRYEQAGYFVDAVSRLSRVIDAPNAGPIAEANAAFILGNSGPAKLGDSTWNWPNTVVGRSLMAAYTNTDQVASPRALQSCVRTSTGVTDASGRDGDIAEEAFYLYGLTADSTELSLAQKYYNAAFINDSSQFSYIDKIQGTGNLTAHGVTAAEQLKLLPLMYSYTGNAQALALAKTAYAKIEANSLMPDGAMVSQEALATTAFNSLHESCDISDWSWSIGYLFMAGGDAHWGDLIEQTIFNALPGATSKNFQQHQYFSSANQIAATTTICPIQASTRMSYRAAHDTECCTGNISRAMPNYVTRMWMGMANGIAATLYGPSQVQTYINQQPVTITETTDYPFKNTITLTVGVPQPVTFSLGLRIPQWSSGATVTVNGVASTVATAPGTFAVLNRSFSNGDTIVVTLPMTIQLKEWLGGAAVSVQRGPLVYSLKIAETRTESTSDPPSILPQLFGNYIAGFPALQFTPASEWRYGMASAQMKAPQTFTVVESPVSTNPFDSTAGPLPVTIQVPLEPLPQWDASWNVATATQNPTGLPTRAEMQSPGAAQTMTLVPYGSTYLRLTMLPVLP
jgi:hypothetical protein